MTGPKITIIGGGSYSWGPLFVRDLLIAPALQNAAIVLHDIDAQALAAVYDLGQIMVQQRGGGHVECTLDLDEALYGADFVILTITTGGLDAMRHDVEIPERYGVYQAVGDTVGPGGLVRALGDMTERLQDGHGPAIAFQVRGDAAAQYFEDRKSVV